MSDSATRGTVFHQAPLSMDSPGKRIGVGSHAFLQGILPTQGLNLQLLYLFALAGRFFTTRATWEAPHSQRPGLNPWSLTKILQTGQCRQKKKGGKVL